MGIIYLVFARKINYTIWLDFCWVLPLSEKKKKTGEENWFTTVKKKFRSSETVLETDSKTKKKKARRIYTDINEIMK